MAKAEHPIRYVCAKCGSPSVEVSAWVDANTNQVSASEGPVDYAYCNDCGDDTELREVD